MQSRKQSAGESRNYRLVAESSETLLIRHLITIGTFCFLVRHLIITISIFYFLVRLLITLFFLETLAGGGFGDNNLVLLTVFT